jgi:hypothetical protein
LISLSKSEDRAAFAESVIRSMKTRSRLS